MVKTCQHLFSLLIYAVFVPFLSLWAEFSRKYPGVIGESGTEAQARNLPFPMGECTDLVQLFPTRCSRLVFAPFQKGLYHRSIKVFIFPNRH